MIDLLPAGARIVDLRSGRQLGGEVLSALVHTRAEEFRQAAVSRGDLLGMCHRDGAVLLVDLLAAWRLGAAGLVLSPSLTEGERRRVVAWARPACWIGEAAPPDVKGLAAELPAIRQDPTPARGTDVALLDDPALVLLTSGTTGKPRGVSLSHRALRIRLAANVARIGHDALARSLVTLPLHFGHGLIGNSLTPLLAGGTLLLWPEPGVQGLAQLGSLIDEHAVTFLSSVPSMWRVALKVAAPPRPAMLRRVHIGSEPLSAELWQDVCRWAGTRQVFNMYGMTEAANWISGASIDEAGGEAGAVGRPWSGSWRLKWEDGSLAAHGRGEVLLSDPALMIEYLNDDAATAAAVQSGWLRTGDIGEIDDTGRLRIVGRMKHQINRGGIKISAEEIDRLLEEHPDVLEACAFALPDAVSGEMLAAAIVPRPGCKPQPADLKAWCAMRIRSEAVPLRITVLSELPRSERGKVRRDEVRRIAFESEGTLA